jgi:predicted alpha/beta-fold hydrolase
VRRPLLVVASDDDPIVPIASLPLLSMEANPHIVTAVTTHGWP